MLGSRFDSSKCKNQCRLCVARIKLLRNKRNIQLRNMHKDVAELLRQKKRDNARIRVEASIREKMTLQAFEILELFLELIEVRSQLLETTKGLPADMVEVISSVVYAAQRMGQELPELVKLRAMFVVKYGKEFVQQASDDATAHTQQVNEQLRAKLSLEPPSAHDKAQELQEIAEAHGVDIENLSLEASTPPPIPEVPQQVIQPQAQTQQQQVEYQQPVQNQQQGGSLEGFLTQGVHQHPQYPPQSISDMEVSEVGPAQAPMLPINSPQSQSQRSESAKASYTDAMAAALAADKAAQEARTAADFAQQYASQFGSNNVNQTDGQPVLGTVVGPPEIPPPQQNVDFDEEKVRQDYEAAPGPPAKPKITDDISMEAPPPPENPLDNLPSAPTQIPWTGPDQQQQSSAKKDELDELRARFDRLKKS